ncbi:MAG: 16S rRNA (guanine(527)-N(7))-methyltransferase RsmG [Vicinamibacterales bacterium]
MPTDFDLWAEARQLRALVSEDQFAKLRTYVELLKTWNAKVNLTGFSLTGDLDEALDRLILEPVSAASLLPEPIQSVVDVGSGGGSPALPLAIAAPRISFTLVESSTRKCVFLREAIRATGLQSARVIAERIEAVAGAPNHETFDAATVRAVRLDAELVGHLSVLVRPGGFLIYFDQAGHESPQGWPSFPLIASKQAETSKWRLRIYQRTP